jgi:ubiquinone/menaquinone biosynthesis C-methylase UbiE
MTRRTQNQQASGRTLIIGAGTGLDIPALGDGVTELILLEPDATMRRTLAQRFPDLPLVAWPAEAMPFDAGSFETVISTFVLCRVVDVERVLREVARVLTPGGQYLFLEHVANPHRGARLFQHGSVPARDRALVAPAWRRLSVDPGRTNRRDPLPVGVDRVRTRPE